MVVSEGVEHVPAAIRREVHERGQRHCTFERGPVFGCTGRSDVRATWRKIHRICELLGG